MAWDHLSIDKPHLVYIILGGFTTLFMLCSSIIKERLYIGEATVATLVGVIFGPHAANLINPLTWGNTDQITLEFSRIVLVVQCFAVGVELPKAYMERHWRSVVFLLVPVMTFGWLMTSLFIWGMFYDSVDWLGSLCIAACVTATDPVLASSVVGKGKFAKRVPKHLRDILSAESGCNDGMAFPFIYLALYIIRYRHNPDEVALEWFCITILYECVFGAFYGFTVGYIARRLIRYSHEREYIDRESFLVFYFVLALFCAGSGSLLGMDDLLIGFACGVGFSNDGWFTEKTEEAHVSNVIDLLLNLSFFVYFGTIIPWAQFNDGVLGMKAWRLVVIALLVIFFRRIPVMMALKPLIPDVKTWREALFAGHFGPIGVGAIFVSILARAELETGGTIPTKLIPDPSFSHYNIIYLIWPITCFLVVTSILVHGSSVAVFTLGKHINTLTLTLSYTHANDQGPTWMDRLPRIQSRSKSSMSLGRYDSDMDEKPLPPGMLPAVGRPGTFLRRQRHEDNPSRTHSRSNSRQRPRQDKNWDRGLGPGGPVSQSAIVPQSRVQSPSPGPEQTVSRSDSETLAMKGESSSSSEQNQMEHVSSHERQAEDPEIYEEGHNTVFEDQEGNVLAVEEESDEGPAREAEEQEEGRRLMRQEGADKNDGVAPTMDDPDEDTGDRILENIRSAEEEESQQRARQSSEQSVEKPAEGSSRRWRRPTLLKRPTDLLKRGAADPKPEEPPPKLEKKHGPARAYQYGNTIVIEDEDGEVIKKYDIPAPDKKQNTSGEQHVARQRIGRMGRFLGLGTRESKDGKIEVGAPGPSSSTKASAAPLEADTKKEKERSPPVQPNNHNDDDHLVRFTLAGSGGRRMSKADFIDAIQQMDPKRRVQAVESSNVPESVKQEARIEAREQAALKRRATDGLDTQRQVPTVPEESSERREKMPDIRRLETDDSTNLQLIDSNNEEIPFHNISADLRSYQSRSRQGETAAERRRRLALQNPEPEEDSEDDGTERVPPKPSSITRPQQQSRTETSESIPVHDISSDLRSHHLRSNQGETAAERRRREAAQNPRTEDDSDDDGTERVPPKLSSVQAARLPENSVSELGETAAERRRREAALGIRQAEESDSEFEDRSRPGSSSQQQQQQQQRQGIRFADQSSPTSRQSARQSTLRWGTNVRQ